MKKIHNKASVWKNSFIFHQGGRLYGTTSSLIDKLHTKKRRASHAATEIYCETGKLNTDRRRAQEPCESRGGRPGFPVPNGPYGICGRKVTWKKRAQELCESRCIRPGLPVPNSPYGLCGRKLTLNSRAQELCESRGGRPGLPVPNSPYGLCGRNATLKYFRSCEKVEVAVLREIGTLHFIVHSDFPIFTWTLGSLRFSNFQLELWVAWIFQVFGSQLFSDFYVEIWVSWMFAVFMRIFESLLWNIRCCLWDRYLSFFPRL